MKYISGLIITLFCILFLFFPQKTKATDCNFTVNTSTSLVNGRVAPYNQIKPGDTICIAAGTRGPLFLRNFAGTAAQPITIINSGGQVIINDSSGWVGIEINNVQHFRFTGTGSTDTYGFVIQKAVTFGILATNKSEYLEIDHFEIKNIIGYTQTGPDGSLGIHIRTGASCPVPNGRNYDDWDYNNDGVINVLDMVDRSNYTEHNIVIHDNYIHGTQPSDIGIAYYIGNANSNYGSYTRDCINPDGSITHGVVVVNPNDEGVHIYNDIIDNLADKVMQVVQTPVGCEINNETITRGAQLQTDDIMAISNSTGSTCDIHNNTIKDSGGVGIISLGSGATIRDNYIENIGTAGTYYHDGIYVINQPPEYHHGLSTHITGNTIINPKGYGITFGTLEGTSNNIENNTIAHPGVGYDYISVESGAHVTVANNIFMPDVPTQTPPAPTPTLRPTASPTPLPTVTPTPTPPPKPGDANGDGKVDEADYAIWLAHYTQHIGGGASVGEFNNDGVVDGIDYTIWVNNFGK